MAFCNSENKIRIQVLQVQSPHHIKIRCGGDDALDPMCQLERQLALYIESPERTSCVKSSHLLKIGENYGVRVKSMQNQWCRCKLVDIMQGLNSFNYRVQLIDHDKECTVDHHSIRHIPATFFELPSPVKVVSLAGLTPLGLVTEYDEHMLTKLKPCKKWSPASTELVRSNTVGMDDVTVVYAQGSQHQVHMYWGDVCINTLLVENNVAAYTKSLNGSSDDKPANKISTKRFVLNTDPIISHEEAMRREAEQDLETATQAEMTPISDTIIAADPIASPFSSPPHGRGRASAILKAVQTPGSTPEDSPNSSGVKSPGKAAHSSPYSIDSFSDSANTDTDSAFASEGKRKKPTLKAMKPPGARAMSTRDLLRASITRPNQRTSKLSPAADPKPQNNHSTSTPTKLKSALSDRSSSGEPSAEAEIQADSDDLPSDPSKRKALVKKAVSFSDTDEVSFYNKASGELLEDKLEVNNQQIPAYYTTPLNFKPEDDMDQDVADYQPTAIYYEEHKSDMLKQQVTVFSDLPIVPYCSYESAKFHDRTRRHWRVMRDSEHHKHGRPLRHFQAFMWKALGRGMECVCVTDPYLVSNEDGVSCSYIMSAATQMFDKQCYLNLPEGCGARFIVLCASWTKANQVFHHAKSIFGEGSDKCMLVLRGLREHEISLGTALLNGTDVIVTTPSTLLLMMEQDFTNLDKLCHLYIDDADIVTQEFPKQLSAIFKSWGLSVRANPERAAPRQLAIFSTRWTESLRLFKEAYLSAEVTILDNKIEAAIACQVALMAQYLKNDSDRLSTMIKLIKNMGYPRRKIVVTVNKDSDGEIVYKALQTQNVSCLLAIRTISTMDSAVDQWCRNTDRHVLIITDEVLLLRYDDGKPVTQATYLLHYNLPNSKNQLGLRFHTLSENYHKEWQNITEYRESLQSENVENKIRERKLFSHVLFSSNDYEAATTVVKLLERLKQKVPLEIRELSLKHITERRQKGSKTELCHYMKSYGSCRDESKCEFRHLISAHHDTPANGMPTSGDVEFKVVSVRDAVWYNVRLLRHRDAEGVLHDIPNNKFILDLKMKEYFSLQNVKLPMDPFEIKPGVVCIYEMNEEFYRAKVIKPIHDAREAFCTKAQVLLLDEGRIGPADASKIYNMPPELDEHAFPPEIVEVRLCNVKPEDHDVNWTSDAISYMTQLLQGQVLSGKIQLCLGRTLWLDPIVKREYLKATNAWIIVWYASLKLQSVIAVKNPEHVPLLRDACKGVIELSEIRRPVLKRTADDALLITPEAPANPATREFASLDEDDVTHVYLGSVENPDLVYLIRADHQGRLQEVEDILTQRVKSKGKILLPEVPSMFTLCAAKYPDGGSSLTRCSFMSVLPNNRCQLISLDYGDIFEEKHSEISAISDDWTDITSLPYQAIECHIATVLPVNTSWSDAAGQMVWDVVSDSQNLFAKVLSRRTSRFLGDQSYGIELIDTTSAEDVSVSRELTSAHLAVPKTLNMLERLGDLGVNVANLDYQFQQIPYLIQLFRKTQNREKRLLITEYIDQLVRSSDNLKHEMRRQSIIKTIINFLRSVEDDELRYHLIESLTLLSTNCTENASDVWWENGYDLLAEMLRTCTDKLLPSVLKCLYTITLSARMPGSVDLETLKILLKLIADNSAAVQCKSLSLDIIQNYITRNPRCADEMFHLSLLDCMKGCLTITSDVCLASLISTLSNLSGQVKAAQAPVIKDDITRSADVHLVQRLKGNLNDARYLDLVVSLCQKCLKINSEQSLLTCMKSLLNILNNLPHLVKPVQSTLLHEKLDRMIDSGMNAGLRQSITQLLQKIKPPKPKSQPIAVNIVPRIVQKPQTIDLKPLPKSELPYINTESRVPKVRWWECRKYLMIQILIHDSQDIKPPSKLSTTSSGQAIEFLCGQFSFKLSPLYGRIVATNSLQQVLHSEMQYALCKEVPGLWSKLLKPGHRKPDFVQPNMDLMIDSSDDDDYEESFTSPFLIKPRFSSYASLKKSSIPKGGIPVDMYRSDSSEQSEEEDVRFNRNESRYDMLNV